MPTFSTSMPSGRSASSYTARHAARTDSPVRAAGVAHLPSPERHDMKKGKVAIGYVHNVECAITWHDSLMNLRLFDWMKKNILEQGFLRDGRDAGRPSSP